MKAMRNEVKRVLELSVVIAFLSMYGMWSAYQRYRNLLSIVTGRVGPSLIMGRRK